MAVAIAAVIHAKREENQQVIVDPFRLFFLVLFFSLMTHLSFPTFFGGIEMGID